MQDLKIKSSWLMLTNQCNLKCSYCWLTNNPVPIEPGVMSLDTAFKAVDFITRIGEEGVNITFFGGEPLLEFETIRAVMDKYPYLNYGLYTNTILLDDAKIDYFIKNRDFIKIVLSIDGLQSTNLKWRGCNYDEDIVKRIFKNFPLSSARFTVLDPSTCFSGAEYLFNLGAPKITINVPNFVNIDKDYYPVFDREVARIKENYSLNSVTTVSDSLVTDCRKIPLCNAAKDFIVVDPDGGLYPCDLFYWFKKNRIGDIDKGIDKNELEKFFSQVESIKNISSGCTAEQLYYKI